jgi:GTPase SAR1 family protein
MTLVKAHVKNYRSVRDSGSFEIEPAKIILVGPNEAGKTVLLRALQQINPPPEVPKFDPLRDYPRSDYNDITTKKVDPAKTDVVVAYSTLEDDDKDNAPEEFRDCVYVTGRRLDNSNWDRLEGGPEIATYGQIKNDARRLAAHMDKSVPAPAEGAAPPVKPTEDLTSLTSNWRTTPLLRIRPPRIWRLG